MDHMGDKLAHLYKLWGDSYALTGEVKGGTIPLNFKRFVVTSNYSINDIFGYDPEAPVTTKTKHAKDSMVSALESRFIVIYLDDRSHQGGVIDRLRTLRP